MQGKLLPNLLGTQQYMLQELADNVPDDLIGDYLCHPGTQEDGTLLSTPKPCFCVAGWMLWLAGYEIHELERLQEDIDFPWVDGLAKIYSITEAQAERLVYTNDHADDDIRQASVRAALLELIGVPN